MLDPHQLAQEASSLDDRQWRVFLDDLGNLRCQRDQSRCGELSQGASRDQVAAWIAGRHLAVDTGITDVWYLPDGAPEQEIRLIEINALLTGLSDEEVAPIDFGFNVEGLHFVLLVVDVTPSQWERLRIGAAALPERWSLKDAQHFGVLE